VAAMVLLSFRTMKRVAMITTMRMNTAALIIPPSSGFVRPPFVGVLLLDAATLAIALGAEPSILGIAEGFEVVAIAVGAVGVDAVITVEVMVVS